jgi:hypothetical protein
MAGILGKIFGSGDVIKSGINLIDSFHTSTEEEIAAKTKAKVDIMNAYAPFKLAQRIIAFSFTFTYLSCFAMVLAFTLMDRVADAGKVQSVLEDFQIGLAMIVILGFYFGAGAAEGFMEKRKAKRDVQNNAMGSQYAFDEIKELWDELASMKMAIGEINKIKQKVALIENDPKYIDEKDNSGKG